MFILYSINKSYKTQQLFITFYRFILSVTQPLFLLCSYFCHCSQPISWCWGQKVFWLQWYLRIAMLIAAQQFYKHSEFSDLLRKSLLPHIWRVPKLLLCISYIHSIYAIYTLVNCFLLTDKPKVTVQVVLVHIAVQVRMRV